MNEKEVESLLKETKAILEGHFLLTSDSLSDWQATE